MPVDAFLPNHVLLGAIAGLTIFLGLPVALWRTAPAPLRGLLAMASAGVLLFLIIEVGHQAMELVEESFESNTWQPAILAAAIFVGGLVLGLSGLAYLEDHRAYKQTQGATALDIATMIAIGIGLHNFSEGLAIGQLFAGGSASLGMVLVIGFALHNGTEGFGIAGPLVGHKVSLSRLLILGLIAGAPTALGALVGGVWVDPQVKLLFLALATGSLVYVTHELFAIKFEGLSAAKSMLALAFGLLLGFGTELIVESALKEQQQPEQDKISWDLHAPAVFHRRR